MVTNFPTAETFLIKKLQVVPAGIIATSTMFFTRGRYAPVCQCSMKTACIASSEICSVLKIVTWNENSQQPALRLAENAIFPQEQPKPVFFDNSDEPQDHVRTSDAIADAAGNPNRSALQLLSSIFEFNSSEPDIADAFTDVRFDPLYDPLTIYNGDFEIGDNRGVASAVFNGDELPGWNFQGGGGITTNDIENPFGNRYLKLEPGGDGAVHNLLYVPPLSDLQLQFEIELPVNSTNSGSGMVTVALGGTSKTVAIPTGSGVTFVETLDVPSELQNTSTILSFDVVGSDVWIDNIRFDSASGFQNRSQNLSPQASIAPMGNDSSGNLVGPGATDLEGEVTDPARVIVRGPVDPLGESRPPAPYVDNAVTGDGVDNASAIQSTVLTAGDFVSDAVRHFNFANSVNQSLRTNAAVLRRRTFPAGRRDHGSSIDQCAGFDCGS